ncbi:Protein of unknown function [Gryllus bimaculatus]|nr:Protein of unknown function [Gryllus bimaculatus]
MRTDANVERGEVRSGEEHAQPLPPPLSLPWGQTGYTEASGGKVARNDVDRIFVNIMQWEVFHAFMLLNIFKL